MVIIPVGSAMTSTTFTMFTITETRVLLHPLTLTTLAASKHRLASTRLAAVSLRCESLQIFLIICTFSKVDTGQKPLAASSGRSFSLTAVILSRVGIYKPPLLLYFNLNKERISQRAPYLR